MGEEYRAEENVQVMDQGDLNLAKKIEIEQLPHGYVVTVGCQRFAIEGRVRLLGYLDKYLYDPRSCEKLWFEGKLFNNKD